MTGKCAVVIRGHTCNGGENRGRVRDSIRNVDEFVLFAVLSQKKGNSMKKNLKT